MRAEVLEMLREHPKQLVVSYPEALFEQVLTPKEIKRKTLEIKQGDELSIDFVNETLFEFGFTRVDFVTEPGSFAVRGGILDVHSFSHSEPYRIEFFGDEVDTLRSFDVTTQLSTEVHDKIRILANIEEKEGDHQRQSFLSFLEKDALLCVQDQQAVAATLDKLFNLPKKALPS